MNEKRLKVCADPFPPYQYLNDEGAFVGTDYFIVKNCLESAGYCVEMSIAPWNEIYPLFEKKEMDVLFQAQDSPERLERFYLSDMFRRAVTEVITTKKELAGIWSHDDLKNYRIGGIDGFTNGPRIDCLPKENKKFFQDTEAILKALDHGQIDFGVVDQGVKNYVKPDDMELNTVTALTYERPLYVLFNSQKVRDDFNLELKRQK